MAAIRAALFDIGGVLTASPVAAIRAFAERTGVDYASLSPLLAAPAGAWSRLETSELTADEFAVAFEAECAAQGLAVESSAFLACFADLPVREEMLAVVRSLRGRLKLGCITNNVRRDTPPRLDLADLFDVVIESSKVGLRKPNPAIYRLACEQLGVAPQEVVFLDDFGVNLKAARALGMTTIKVDETDRAIRELELVLGFPLPRPEAPDATRSQSRP